MFDINKIGSYELLILIISLGGIITTVHWLKASVIKIIDQIAEILIKLAEVTIMIKTLVDNDIKNSECLNKLIVLFNTLNLQTVKLETDVEAIKKLINKG